MIECFVVQSFERGRKGSLVPGVPVEAQSSGHAIRLAERLAASAAGVVAFSRKGDPSTGEYFEAEIILAHGDVPDLEADTVGAC